MASKLWSWGLQGSREGSMGNTSCDLSFNVMWNPTKQKWYSETKGWILGVKTAQLKGYVVGYKPLCVWLGSAFTPTPFDLIESNPGLFDPKVWYALTCVNADAEHRCTPNELHQDWIKTWSQLVESNPSQIQEVKRFVGFSCKGSLWQLIVCYCNSGNMNASPLSEQRVWQLHHYFCVWFLALLYFTHNSIFLSNLLTISLCPRSVTYNV